MNDSYIAQVSQPPRVSGLPRDGLCSLVLSNPDGHLLNHNMELLHWMMYVGSIGERFSEVLCSKVFVHKCQRPLTAD